MTQLFQTNATDLFLLFIISTSKQPIASHPFCCWAGISCLLTTKHNKCKRRKNKYATQEEQEELNISPSTIQSKKKRNIMEMFHCVYELPYAVALLLLLPSLVVPLPVRFPLVVLVHLVISTVLCVLRRPFHIPCPVPWVCFVKGISLYVYGP